MDRVTILRYCVYVLIFVTITVQAILVFSFFPLISDFAIIYMLTIIPMGEFAIWFVFVIHRWRRR